MTFHFKGQKVRRIINLKKPQRKTIKILDPNMDLTGVDLSLIPQRKQIDKELIILSVLVVAAIVADLFCIYVIVNV